MIGFTGTQIGMTLPQRASTFLLLETFRAMYPHAVLRHGDCIGADAEADALAASLRMTRLVHPCTLESMRAHCELRGALLEHEPSPPRVRNVRIVKLSRIMVATPRTPKEVVRSGTWMTVRIARRFERPVWIVWPDGRVEAERR